MIGSRKNDKTMNALRFILCSFLIVGCELQPKVREESLHILRQFSSNFCLLDHSLEKELEAADSSSLIFCKADPFAQSYILVIKRKHDVIRGVYQEFDLSARGLSASNKSQGIFFKGFSLEVDPLIWRGVKERSLQVIAQSRPDDYNEGLMDGVPYLLRYNGKEFLANKSDSKKICDDLARYINDEIVIPMKFERDSISR
jgi:hypothetical protein